MQTPRGPEAVLVGGRSWKDVPVSHVEIYNVRQRKWRNGPSLPGYARTVRVPYCTLALNV